MELIDVILEERPAFHRGETEVDRSFRPSESFLSRRHAERLVSQEPACYGISRGVAYFIRDSVGLSSRTLETGAGISTLVFAIAGAVHTAVTPNQTEVEAVRTYPEAKHINLESTWFIIGSSARFLPNLDIDDVDMVLLDGKHAFPWPILDWFYTASLLRRGGVMLVDDAQVKSVKILVDFMSVDPGWSIVKSLSDKAFAFRKERARVHDVAWHMQPYNFIHGDSLELIGGILSRIVPEPALRRMAAWLRGRLT